jgi:hypothetical protein
MARRCVAVCLALLVASPALAQDLRGSIRRAASLAAAQQTEPPRTGMHPGLLWTGVGLLGAGGLSLGLGAAEDPENETCVSGSDFEETCVSNRTVLLASGAVMAGVGGVLLWIGAVKARDNAPSITFGPGRFVVHQRLPLTVFGR